jgi:hypothetical protein
MKAIKTRTMYKRTIFYSQNESHTNICSKSPEVWIIPFPKTSQKFMHANQAVMPMFTDQTLLIPIDLTDLTNFNSVIST